VYAFPFSSSDITVEEERTITKPRAPKNMVLQIIK